jgi:RND family efflux transporter MFP subunit
MLLALGCSKKEPINSAVQAAQSPGASKAQGTSDTVELTVEQQRQAGVRTASVETRSAPQSLIVTGKVSMDEQHTAHIGALADGIVENVYVLPGDNVRAGQSLAKLHSHLIHETAGALAQAYAQVQEKQGALRFAEQARVRYEHLYNIRAASAEEDQHAKQQLIQAQAELLMAEASVHQEREHLSELLQVKAESLNVDNIFKFEDIPIRTPLSGVVIKRNVTAATVVQAGTEAFVVSDPSTVWVTGAVNEKDIALVKIGSPVTVKVQGYPNELFHGRVGQLGSALDSETRTVPVRVVVPNSGLKLRPEMFATAEIHESVTHPAIFIPEDAVQEIKGIPTVFVAVDRDHFRAQSVTLGTRSDGHVEVFQGLRQGDRVAIAGAFMVKSGLLKSSLGGK